MVVMDIFTRRIISFGVAAANLDGPSVSRMFNRAMVRQRMPRHLSSDHDPLFRFQRWLANLRILEIDEIKSIPGTPRSHAFVERLIGTIRREHLDQTLFWNQGDLERKLDSYKVYDNRHRCHTGLAGITPAQRGGAPVDPFATSTHTAGENTATGSFRPRLPPELYFATHTRSTAVGYGRMLGHDSC